MREKIDKHLVEEMKEAIQKKDPNEPVEKTLVTFCARAGVSMDTCRIYYRQLVKKGEIKE